MLQINLWMQSDHDNNNNNNSAEGTQSDYLDCTSSVGSKADCDPSLLHCPRLILSCFLFLGEHQFSSHFVIAKKFVSHSEIWILAQLHEFHSHRRSFNSSFNVEHSPSCGKMNYQPWRPMSLLENEVGVVRDCLCSWCHVAASLD